MEALLVGILLVLTLIAVLLARRSAQPPASAGASSNAPIKLPVVQAPPSCGRCAHFDLAAGQREMQKQVPFWAAAQSIPPWRMGRVLRKDDKGNDLPFAEQGIDPALLELTWEEGGVCKHHGEIRFAPTSCEAFTPAERA